MRLIKGEETFWRWVVISVLVLISLPIVSVVFQIQLSFFQDLFKAFGQSYTLNTLILIILTSTFSLLFGVSTAWFTANYNFPFAKYFGWLLMLPLAIPSYILAYTYKGIFGLFGTIHSALGFYFSIDNIWWLSVIMALSLYPYVYLTTRVSFALSSSKFIRSSLSLGASDMRTFFRIALPLSWPAVFSGLILVIMEVINNYGAVHYFGVKTFTTEIVRLWNPMDGGPVRNIASILICIIVFIYVLEKQVRKRASFQDKESGKQGENSKQSTKHPWLMVLICCIPTFFGFIIPFVQLFAWAYKKVHLLFEESLLEVILTTFVVGLITAVISALLALVIRYYVQHGQKIKMIQRLARFSTLGYAIPGALLGVGILDLLFVFNDIFSVVLTSSFFVLTFAYVVRFFSVSYGTIHSGFEKVVKNVGYASFSLGSGFTRTLFKIHSPLLKKTLLAASVLVFVDVIKELPLTMMFQNFNFQTLAVKAFMLMETDGAVYDASLPSLLIVVISIFPVYFVNKWIS